MRSWPHRRTAHAARLVCLSLGAAWGSLLGCTPIDPPNKAAPVSTNAANGGATDGAAGDPTGAGGTGPRADGGTGGTSGGSSERTATLPAIECVGREPNVPFCDSTVQLVCDGAGASTKISCGENEQCLAFKDRARCACDFGAMPTDDGCKLSAGCEGACDSMTQCQMLATGRKCTPCPEGYTGTGELGCIPTLLALEVTCGTLTTPLVPTLTDLRVAAPLLCASTTLKLTVPMPDATLVTINGQAANPELTWTLDNLALGETQISITLSAGSGVSQRYTVTVVRGGQQVAFLKASNPGTDNRLGASIAIDKDVIVAGAPNENGGVGGVNPMPSGATAAHSGAAYVFERDGNTWKQRALLKAETAASEEYFGSAVAILGDVIAVGAPGNDPTNQPQDLDATGAVYLFKREGDTWKQREKVVVADATGGDMLGFQVLLTPTQLLATAPFENSVVAQSGAAYVFARNDTTVSLPPERLKCSRPSSLAGWGTGLAFDGTTIAVGAFSDSTKVRYAGSGSVFTRQDGKWTEQQLLEPSRLAPGGTFGFSMAVLDDTLLVGAVRWGHFFPTSSGEVYVFKRTGNKWDEVNVLTARFPRDQDFFGSSIILTPNWLLIGANGDASKNAGVAADPNDDSRLASGGIYLYARRGDDFVNPILIKASKPVTRDSFGVAVGVSGETLTTGASYNDEVTDSGAVHVIR